MLFESQDTGAKKKFFMQSNQNVMKIYLGITGFLHL